MPSMADNAEIRALTTSIGEHSVDNIGKENVRGLQVLYDDLDCSAAITVELADNAEQMQRAALASLIEVEQLFYDEAVLSFHFVDDIAAHGDMRVARKPQYSYA